MHWTVTQLLSNRLIFHLCKRLRMQNSCRKPLLSSAARICRWNLGRIGHREGLQVLARVEIHELHQNGICDLEKFCACGGMLAGASQFGWASIAIAITPTI